MKKILLSLFVAALVPGFLYAQPNPSAPSPSPGMAPQPFRERLTATANPQPENPLPRFNLDFPGGDPGNLVQAIQRASGHPLNAIIPNEYASLHIPPLKMNSVTVPELFAALQRASVKQVTQVTGTYFAGVNQSTSQYQTVQTSYGFETIGNPREDSIWYFFRSAPPTPADAPPAQDCRFFNLGPYLEYYKVEDITTAIESGWDMLGAGRDFERPQVSFHKDTKLLIAVGDPAKLRLIDSVLEQLRDYRPPKPPAPAKSGDAAKP